MTLLYSCAIAIQFSLSLVDGVYWPFLNLGFSSPANAVILAGCVYRPNIIIVSVSCAAIHKTLWLWLMTSLWWANRDTAATRQWMTSLSQLDRAKRITIYKAKTRANLTFKGRPRTWVPDGLQSNPIWLNGRGYSSLPVSFTLQHHIKIEAPLVPVNSEWKL